MYDNTKLRFYTKEIEYYRKNICYYKRENPSTGEMDFFNKDCMGFYVLLQRNKVTITGSLHKFFTGGRNYDFFTRSNIEEAVKNFCKLFKIQSYEPSLKIISLEVGINIPTNYLPLEYAKCMIKYSNSYFHPCKRKRRTAIEWGVECDTCDNHYKFYDKSIQTNLTFKGSPEEKEKLKEKLKGNLLRFEISYRRIKKRRNHNNLSFLYSDEFLHKMRDDFIKKYNRIVKRRRLDTSKMKNPIKKLYHLGGNAEYWEDMRKQSPATFKQEKKVYKNLDKEYKFSHGDLIDELDGKIKQILDYLIEN